MSKPRSIFEEVSDAGPRPAPQRPKGRRSSRGTIRAWLLLLFALVTLMIAVGGMTRLTDSGLSITEWKPVTGAIPPANDEVWNQEFEKYKATPEFQLQNSEMTLAEFKGIYWWEWGHRFLGRLIGLIWFLGFVWFQVRRQIPAGWTGRLLGIGALGGLQGAVGWWMVASGLTGRMVDVASYRLATHLGLAFLILGLIAWFVFRLGREEGALLQQRRQREGGLMTLAGAMVAVLFLQVLLGALVAGIDAGRSFPTWPSMAGAFLPSESFDYRPLWTNFFENPALVQFNHRLVGYLAFLIGAFAWWRSRKSAQAGVRARFDWLLAMLFGQMVLGVATVLYGAAPHIAIVHQLGAVALFALALRARFEAAYPEPQKIRRG